MRDASADVELAALPRTRAVLEAGRARGLHDAARVHVRVGAGEGWGVGVGAERSGPDVHDSTLFSWTCATKPILAVGLGILVDRSVLSFEDELRRWLPEAPREWEAVTLTHLLAHTVGWVGDPGVAAALTDWDDALSRLLGEGRVDGSWPAGTRAAYSVWTGWLLLGEVVRRTTGEEVCGWLSREVLRPFDLEHTWLVLDHESYDRVEPRLAPLVHRGADPHPFVFDGRDYAHRCWPGLSARGPASDLSRLFQALMLDGQGRGPGVLSAATARRLVTPARIGIVDEASGIDYSWGLGFTVDRRAVHPRASEGTFSHAGIGSSSFAFADPARSLAAALTTDGITDGLGAMARRFGVVQAVYADVASICGAPPGADAGRAGAG